MTVVEVTSRPPVEEIEIPFDPDEVVEASDIDCKSMDAILTEFDAGALNESDFQLPSPRRPEDYGPEETVPVEPIELPPELESDLPQVEELLSRIEAERFLDELVPNGDWRRWGVPPFSRAFGKVVFSPLELTRWVRDRLGTK